MAGACCDVTAAGCEDPVLPGGVAFRRDGNRGVMTCVNEPRVHQYIMCEENAWNGDILDCSQRVGDSLSHGNYNDSAVKRAT